MINLTFPIALQLIGIGVIIAEIILPSGGILSILAILVFGYSLNLVFTHFSTNIAVLFVTVDLITIPILIYMGFKLLARSPVTLRTTLSREKGVSSQDSLLAGLVGKSGVATSTLRPSGIAEIQERRIDVVTRGEYLEKGTRVIVQKVTGNQVIVQELTDSAENKQHKP